MSLTITAVLVGLMFGPPEVVLPRLELAPAARALLAAFAASPTERLGCLLGSVDGATVRVTSVLATDDSAPDRSCIKRWARAIRSAALKPRISQSGRLTLKYRRPMGAQLGIVLDL